MKRKKPKNRIWSYSTLAMFEGCPRKYKWMKIEKRPQKPSRAAARGIQIHKLAEGLLNGEVTGMPDELRKFQKEFRAIKRLKFNAESMWRIDKNWQPTTDWGNTWGMAKVDADHYDESYGVLDMIDFKTGRLRAYTMQEEVYSMIGKSFHPELTQVETEFWFLDEPFTVQETYTAKRIDKLKAKYAPRIKKMMDASRFPATPSQGACKWCPYRSDKQQPDGGMGKCHAFKKLQ